MSDWGVDSSDYDEYNAGEPWQRQEAYQQEFSNNSGGFSRNFYQDQRWADRSYSYQQKSQMYEQRDPEQIWMEKHLVAWQELLANQEYYLRKELNKSVGSVSSSNDLGTKFNDPQLNRKIQDGQSGEERDLFTCDLSLGTAQFTCSACRITVAGIKVLQSHINGKKHNKNVSGYKIIGEYHVDVDFRIFPVTVS